MIPEEDDRGTEDGRRTTDTWHVVKGIPVAVIAAFVIQTLCVVGGGAWIARGVIAQQEKQGDSIVAIRLDIAALTVKMEGVQTALQSGNVPAALNQRRIEELERQVSALSQLAPRVSDNDRRITAIESRAALLEARGRATKER